MESKKIWDFFLSKIGNEYGVSALMGNLYVESKLNPTDLEGSYSRKLGMSDLEYTNAVDNGSYSKDSFINDHAGYGIAQWTYWSRKDSLYEYAKKRGASIGDLDMQLEFLWDELQSYKTVMFAIANAESIREASDVVAIKYEKPKNVTEEYLQNRANFGQDFYDQFKGGDSVNTAKQVESLLAQWKQQGLSKADIVVNLANACIGWAYVFGARGEYCTPANRRKYFASKGSKNPTIKSKCKNFEGNIGCAGCKWYPAGTTRFFDCRGFTYWCFLNGAGITIYGTGATPQYNDDSNWDEKGPIENMPKDKVCCVFRWDGSTMAHTLIYDGKGNYIHDSGEVKKTAMSKYNATHYAIPKGLYENGGESPVSVQAKVVASSGGSVNMRAKTTTTSAVITRVPIGKIVDVTEKNGDWSKVVYSGMTGYMMTKFLNFNFTPEPVSPEPSTPSADGMVSVKKSDLETIYKMIGDMLGK